MEAVLSADPPVERAAPRAPVTPLEPLEEAWVKLDRLSRTDDDNAPAIIAVKQAMMSVSFLLRSEGDYSERIAAGPVTESDKRRCSFTRKSTTQVLEVTTRALGSPEQRNGAASYLVPLLAKFKATRGRIEQSTISTPDAPLAPTDEAELGAAREIFADAVAFACALQDPAVKSD